MRGKRLYRFADFRALQSPAPSPKPNPTPTDLLQRRQTPGWVEQRPEPDWQSIEGALRRALTIAERERMQKAINLQFTIFELNRRIREVGEVRNQDVIETLRGLAKLSEPKEVTAAYARSGYPVWVEVQLAMHRAGVRDSNAITNPTPDQIRTFAGTASRDVRRPSGRPQAMRMFDERIVALWKELGGTLTDGSGRLSSSLILFARELHKNRRPKTRQEVENLPALRARLRVIVRS